MGCVRAVAHGGLPTRGPLPCVGPVNVGAEQRHAGPVCMQGLSGVEGSPEGRRKLRRAEEAQKDGGSSEGRRELKGTEEAQKGRGSSEGQRELRRAEGAQRDGGSSDSRLEDGRSRSSPAVRLPSCSCPGLMGRQLPRSPVPACLWFFPYHPPAYHPTWWPLQGGVISPLNVWQQRCEQLIGIVSGIHQCRK